eukprot:CAMPEP_0181338344 /NCGR_PEP_ID=MMETSP1101-20121128/28585_1 /TAXON_ID=46948 /ORGANISM="Rhodomonas abbreviata, Strain Caron Lab Isolate" /LENGTH=92 /DNA_ID=CAMNT_0023449065 /DNA_START=140 /DNA_END=418 /DNA_ORIENTATION=+
MAFTGKRLLSSSLQHMSATVQGAATQMPATQEPTLIDHVDFDRIKGAAKEFNAHHTSPSDAPGQITWANIIPMKDPSEYKDLLRKFNLNRAQ